VPSAASAPGSEKLPERPSRGSRAPLGVREALAWTAAAAAAVAAVTLGVSSGSSLTKKSEAAVSGRPVEIMPLSAGRLLPADVSRTMANGARLKISASGAIIAQAQRIVLQPGAAEPWHVHPGSALATVASGTLYNYVEYGSGCRLQIVRAGHSVFESGTTPHTLVNRGKVPAVVYATVFTPVGAAQGLQLKPKPPQCGA
jgi:quercetin dioxygenase-like cupin family protein